MVKTVDDFGSQGEPPSHPELLDWLAVDFRESGWDVKRFYRQILLSATYRQSGRDHSGEAGEGSGKPAAQPRAAIPAGWRMVRDYALAASGLLVAADRRSERKAIPARRGLGSGRDERVEHAVLQAGHGRRLVSQIDVHVLEAECSSGEHGHLQCADAGNLHGPARADEYAAAGAGDHERCAVRGSCAGIGRAQHEGNASTSMRSWIIITARLLARTLTVTNERCARKSFDDFRALLSSTPRDRAKLLATGERKPDPVLSAPELCCDHDADQSANESG